MQVLITVTRRTRYTSIVEMDEERYERLKEDTGPDANEEINSLIDVNDWQDDSLEDVDEFKPYKPAP